MDMRRLTPNKLNIILKKPKAVVAAKITLRPKSRRWEEAVKSVRLV